MSRAGTSTTGRHWVAQCIFWTIAAFYAYGACVHVANMLSLTGFDWGAAPLKWQALDVVYLMLDVTVAIGLLASTMFGVVVFFTAASSQIVLYTLFRDWIVDVPVAFQRSAEQLAYLDQLVLFHLVTLAAMVCALCVRRTTAPAV